MDVMLAGREMRFHLALLRRALTACRQGHIGCSPPLLFPFLCRKELGGAGGLRRDGIVRRTVFGWGDSSCLTTDIGEERVMTSQTPGADPARRRLTVAIVVVTGLALVALTAVGVLALQRSDTSAGEKGKPSDETVAITDDALADLVRDRSDALSDGDEERFLSAFSGQAKDQQRVVFRNLRKVKLESASFHINGTAGRLESSFGSVTARVDVAFAHQIAGVDVQPLKEGYRWTVTKKDAKAKPVITAVDGAPYKLRGPDEPVRKVAYPAPWDLYRDLRVIRTDHVALMTDAAHADAARSAAPQLEKAGRDVLAAWKADGPSSPPAARGFAVTFEPDSKRLAKLYGHGGEPGNEDGFAASLFNDSASDDFPFGGARVVLKSATARVGKHEMTHALLAPMMRHAPLGALGGPQTWLVEGAAEYMAGGGLDDRGGLSALRRVGFNGRLPDSMAFYVEDAHQQAANYELGRLAVTYLAEKYGEKKALAFVAAQYDAPDKLDEQITTATGLDKAGFEAQWAAYVRSTLK
ncbi:hypothetical protein AB0I22_14185 [Streptomyces sp. NPDC050610]|uniref:hypothetical protein n=1 Tax=Streptomyces sp. NPDC050610 TaxID=3157097 RepID=UPI00343CEC4F